MWPHVYFLVMCVWCARHTQYTIYLCLCWYGAVCWDPYREGQLSALIRMQKIVAKVANNVIYSGWETLEQRRLIARICALLNAYTGIRAWIAIGNRLQNLCYLSRSDHNRKLRNGKQITDAGKYSFVNKTIKSWNQLPYKSLSPVK